jgi:hypothetical protein
VSDTAEYEDLACGFAEGLFDAYLAKGGSAKTLFVAFVGLATHRSPDVAHELMTALDDFVMSSKPLPTKAEGRLIHT